MEKPKLQKILQYLTKQEIPQNEFNERWKMFLDTLSLTHDQVVRAILDVLEKKGETLGLAEPELLRLAERLPVKPIRRLIYSKLSPNSQEKHADLAEAEDLEKKDLDWLDKAVIKGLHNEAQNLEQMQGLLQQLAASGNADYLGKLQGKLQAKDLMILAQKIMDLGDTGASSVTEVGPAANVGTTTTTVNTAPYPVPLGSMAPWKKKKKKNESMDEAVEDPIPIAEGPSEDLSVIRRVLKDFFYIDGQVKQGVLYVSAKHIKNKEHVKNAKKRGVERGGSERSSSDSSFRRKSASHDISSPSHPLGDD